MNSAEKKPIVYIGGFTREEEKMMRQREKEGDLGELEALSYPKRWR